MILKFQWTILWYTLKKEYHTAITKNEVEIMKNNSQNKLLNKKRQKIYLPQIFVDF